MGGCRCTYKNCTIRSDGKTHLFHYPVFDKVRCHEWLTRAGRYDFLNLKVSQLKNRCICQYHFADDCFMNNMKEKLKSKAVPTLDGPFCDSSKFEETEMQQNMLGSYPLPCEVIEIDDTFLDRKSNYNLLYSDFLTNGDALEYPFKTEIENVTPASNNNIIDVYTHRMQSTDVKPKILNDPYKDSSPAPKDIVIDIPPLPILQCDEILTKNNEITITPSAEYGKKSKVRILSEKKITEPEKKIIVPISAASFEVVKPSMVLSINKNKSRNIKNITMPQPNYSQGVVTTARRPEKSVSNAKEDVNDVVEDILKRFYVKDEQYHDKSRNIKNITMPQPNYSQGVVTTARHPEKSVSNAKEDVNDVVEDILKRFYVKDEQALQNNMALPQFKEEESSITAPDTNESSKFQSKMNLTTNPPPPPSPAKVSPQKKLISKVTTTKNTMSPERLASINEKRKFNMKLKDIIAKELSCLDEQDPIDKEILLPKKMMTTRSKIDKTGSDRVRTSLARDPSLPNDHAYIVHYLEARMERMENLLLNKIDQNTKKIIDLKRSLDIRADNEPVLEKPTIKTNLNDESHKKELYKEISKYLTASCNSQVYEELFINKYVPNESKAPAPTKRKRNR